MTYGVRGEDMAFSADEFLNYFGFQRIKNHDAENMMASCFQWEMHTNDDRKRSFGIRKDTGVANCYVCGGWNVEQLTKELLNREAEFKGVEKRYTEFDALTFLEEKGWLPEEDSIEDLKKQFEAMEGIEFKDVLTEFKKEETHYLDESSLDDYKKSMHKRTLQRGETLNAISVDVARFFELGFDKVTKRIIVPVREEYGNLVGVISRATRDDDFIRYGVGTINPAWFMAQYTNTRFDGEKMLHVFDKRHYVFGEHLWYVEDEHGKRKLRHSSILLVESPLDVVYAWSQGLQDHMNIGAIFGSKCTKEQLTKVLRHEYVVEALDNDKGGIEGREHFYKHASGKCKLYTCDSFNKKDLGDCTPDEVQLISTRFKTYEQDLFTGIEEMN
jgi:hypothetical protein